MVDRLQNKAEADKRRSTLALISFLLGLHLSLPHESPSLL